MKNELRPITLFLFQNRVSPLSKNLVPKILTVSAAISTEHPHNKTNSQN